MAEAVPSSWLLETIVTFLRSPMYKAPMMEFIDTHCDVFTGEDENKFEHSSLHQAYIELSMSLIESFLHEIGISQEAFAAACGDGIKRGGAEAAVFSQIIAADDFLTFKRMMYARSASLDFQAHLQYEKIRNSSMPNSAAAAMVACGQQDVSRNQEYHQHTKQHHELQPPSRNFDSASSAPPLRNQDTTHSMDSDDSVDDDERLLQQAIELSKLAFEEMRSQAQQMADDLETAVRLSILEAEEHSKRLQIAEKEQKDASALSASSNSNDSASQSDSWKMELEAARQREQKALLSFAMAQQQAVEKMEIIPDAPSVSLASSAFLPIPTMLPTSQPLPELSTRSSALPRLGALPSVGVSSRSVSDSSASSSLQTDSSCTTSTSVSSSGIAVTGFGSRMDPLELHKRKQHLESLRDQIRQREQQERRHALSDTSIAPSSAPLSEAQLQQRRELAERLKSL